MVAPICLAEGIDPTRFAIRWTTPPSSSVMMKGLIPSGATAFSACSWAPMLVGADEPNRITPPAPAATSDLTDMTLFSSTGTTTVCSARRVTVQVASIDAVVQGVGVASTPITITTGAVGVAVGVPLGDGVTAVGLGAIRTLGPSPTPAQAERTRALAMESQRAAAPSRCGMSHHSPCTQRRATCICLQLSLSRY